MSRFLDRTALVLTPPVTSPMTRLPQARLFVERLSGRKGCAPFFLGAVFGMKCIHPAPAQSFFQSETRVLPETLIQEISGAVGQFAPDHRGKRVNDKPQAVFTSPHRFLCPLTLSDFLSQDRKSVV